MADKMKVFISWSQSDSEKIAKILKEELTALFNEEIEFWVSTEDISVGNVGVHSIVQALQSSEIIITCLDSNNYKNPWLYFETGAVFGRKHNSSKEKPVVFPIIFDELQIKDFVHTPFESLQLMKFNKNKFKDMVKSINEHYKSLTNEPVLNPKPLDRYFESAWNKIDCSVNNIITQRNNGADGEVLNSENVIEKLKKYSDFPEAKHGKTIQYSSGFETIEFYKFLLENVSDKLYIFGRKNKKIVSNDLKKQFKKIVDNNVKLKMLYINPDSDDAKNGVAQDTVDFRIQLIASMKSATERFNHNFKIEDHCRLYNEKRISEIVIADNVVFYKDLGYTKDGKPAHFTGESFNVVSLDSQIGSNYYKIFNDVWENSEKLTQSYIDSLK